MELFERVAPFILTYHLRANWLSISKLFNDLAREYDSTLAMAFVLLAIDEDEGTPVTKIAPRMGMEPNSLSRLLNSLEQKKAILRKNDTQDQRKVYVYLTELGYEFRKIALQTVLEVENEMTKDLSKEEKQIFLKSMTTISNTIHNIRSDIEKFKEERSRINTDPSEIISKIF